MPSARTSRVLKSRWISLQVSATIPHSRSGRSSSSGSFRIWGEIRQDSKGRAGHQHGCRCGPTNLNSGTIAAIFSVIGGIQLIAARRQPGLIQSLRMHCILLGKPYLIRMPS